MPKTDINHRHIISVSALLGIILVLSACSHSALLKSPSNTSTVSPLLQRDAMTMASVYRIGPGDRLDIVVEGVRDHSGQFDVNGTGQISMPFIGNIHATGMTLQEFKTHLTRALREYIRNPKVRVAVLNYRPFYIQGEVRKGGQYAYREGLDVRRAIAIAGGYTYRAVRKYVFIQRANDTKERRVSLNKPVIIQPGDNIRVPERFF